MFEQEVRRTLEYVGSGNGVRIVGASGSGRTTVARRAAAGLEKIGATVYNIRGLRSHRRIPFAGIHSLGMDIKVGLLGVLGVADTLASELAGPGVRVFVVDDVEFLDNESLAVIDAVLYRAKRPLVVTMRDSVPYSKKQLAILGRGPEAQIELKPLRYEHVHELISDALGAPADADTTARILRKSAGNPNLVVRIAETAALSHALTLSGGQWRMRGETLWNEHLRGTVEELLEGLDSEELTGLHTMAIVGTAPIDLLQQVVDSDVLDRLESRGFVSVVEQLHNGMCAAINPPLVADYFRGQRMFTGRRVLRNRIARTLKTVPRVEADTSSSDSLVGALNSLRLERGTDDVAAARHFHEQVQIHERRHFELWDADKSVANAANLLRVYWGAPLDARRIERVFDQTDTSGGKPGDLLFLVFTQALWAIYSGKGLDPAVGMLRNFGSANPQWEAEAEASALFFQASFDRMPDNLGDNFDRLRSRHPETGVLACLRGMLELYRYNPSAALKAIDSAEGFEIFPRVEPFIRGMALFSSGQIEASLLFALDQRAEARRNLDQFGLVCSSYIAAQALIYRGDFEDAEYVMSGVFAMGRPGFLVDSLHDAMLRLAGLRVATSATMTTPTLATQARRKAVDIGPLPGTGKAVYDLVAARPILPPEFDDEAVNLVERQLERGYVLEAALCALFCMCLLPSKRVLDILRPTLRKHGATSHDQLMAIATAVVQEDHQLLGILLQHYEPDPHLYQVGMLLRGAHKRHVLTGDTCAAEAIERSVAVFAARFPRINEPLSFNTGAHLPLTIREIEVSALAGHLTNVEIGEHLGISARTVENHISNALRKTGTTSRRGLYDVVRNSPSSP